MFNSDKYLNFPSELIEKEDRESDQISDFSNFITPSNLNNNDCDIEDKEFKSSDTMEKTSTPFNLDKDGCVKSVSNNDIIYNSERLSSYKTTTMRMLKRDSIYKKIKSKFFTFINIRIKSLIKKDKKISKIPSNIINNVTLDFNKSLFNNNLQNIYIENCVLFRTDDDIWNFTNTEKEFRALKTILSTKLSVLYSQYLIDKSYEEDKKQISEFSKEKKKIKEEDVIKYIHIIDSYADQLLNYYSDSK
jgi:hypothetical protein